MSEFPNDEVLIARGKYSTLASERRAVYKALRDDVEAIVGSCQRALRFVDKETDFAIEESTKARARIDGALNRLHQAVALTHHLDELKPLAWGDKKEIE